MLQTPNSRNQTGGGDPGLCSIATWTFATAEKHKARKQAKQTQTNKAKQSKTAKQSKAKQASKQKAKEAQTQANKQAPARQASALHTQNDNACDVEQTQRIYHFTPQAYTTHTTHTREQTQRTLTKIGERGREGREERGRESGDTDPKLDQATKTADTQRKESKNKS